MKILLVAFAVFATTVCADAQSAMPGQVPIASTLLHQTRIAHVAVRSHMPLQHAVPSTAFPSDRADYSSVKQDPVPDTHESQPSF